MEPIISPHDTAFIRSDPSGRATLVVVSGSARDYLAHQQEAPQESPRLTPFGWWVTISGICLGLASVALVAWTLLTDTSVTEAAIIEFIIIAVLGIPLIIRMGIMPGDNPPEMLDLAHQVNVLNNPARPASFLVRTSKDAAVDFNPRNRGLFEYVLETMTPQRRTRIRELAETGERTVVRQALVLLAQEYEPRHRQEQEEQRAQRLSAAHALLGASPDDPQRPDPRRSR